jgi:hypothetical protein
MHPGVAKDKLDFVIVEDIAQPDGMYKLRSNLL